MPIPPGLTAAPQWYLLCLSVVTSVSRNCVVFAVFSTQKLIVLIQPRSKLRVKACLCEHAVLRKTSKSFWRTCTLTSVFSSGEIRRQFKTRRPPSANMYCLKRGAGWYNRGHVKGNGFHMCKSSGCPCAMFAGCALCTLIGIVKQQYEEKKEHVK